MKGKIFVGRSRELEALHKALRRGSDDRALLVAGDKGLGKPALLERFWQDACSSGSPALLLNLGKLSSLRDAKDIPAALVQSLDGSTSALQGRVAAFAQSFGRATFTIERQDPEDSEGLSKEQQLAHLWTEEFLKAFPLGNSSPGNPLVYVTMDDMDQIHPSLLTWFLEEFISKWQESGIDGAFRYLVTSSKWPLDESALRFIEEISSRDPLLVRLDPLSEEECSELARKHGITNISGSDLFTKTKGIPSFLEDELEMHSVTRAPFQNDDAEAPSLPKGLSDQQTQWLSRAACLPILSTEGLALFYDKKEASEAFNWLRYSSKMTNKLSGRNIGLKEDVRQAALDWFRKKDASSAQTAINRADRFADFQKRVPSEDERRMLMVLSHFLFFNKKALRGVVGDDVDQYLAMVKQRSSWFVKTGHNYQILPEYREICLRFRELMGESPEEIKIKEKIAACWQSKKLEALKQKEKLLSGESRLASELASIDSQVKALASASEKLLQSGKPNVSRNGKGDRQVQIGTSVGFLVLGIMVLALSLGMRDLFSVYHTAAGIFLTLAGVFWPIVQTERIAAASASGMDQFASETQQRVMQFRLNGLKTRRANAREGLGKIQKDARDLDEILEEPYLLDS